jgi:hypothetical protein
MRIRLSTDSSTASTSSWHTRSISTRTGANGTNNARGTKAKRNRTDHAKSAVRSSESAICPEWREKGIQKTLEQVSDGTADSFSEIMAKRDRSLFLKVPLRLLHFEYKKTEEWKEKKREPTSRSVEFSLT